MNIAHVHKHHVPIDIHPFIIYLYTYLYIHTSLVHIDGISLKCEHVRMWMDTLMLIDALMHFTFDHDSCLANVSSQYSCAYTPVQSACGQIFRYEIPAVPLDEFVSASSAATYLGWGTPRTFV